MRRIDPLGEVSWSFAWGHNILEAVKLPPGEVVGLSAAREVKRMTRPESQRAFDLWKGVFKPDDIARGDRGQAHLVHTQVAFSNYWQGKFASSLAHCERAVALSDSAQRDTRMQVLGNDQGVSARQR